MIILFVLFMLFIFVGYHNSKYLQRQEDEEGKKPSASDEQRDSESSDK